MATNRFIKWIFNEQEYLITFQILENEFGRWQKYTVIIKSDLKKWMEEMKLETHKFVILFIIKI